MKKVNGSVKLNNRNNDLSKGEFCMKVLYGKKEENN